MSDLTPEGLECVLSSFTSQDLADLCAELRLPISGSKDERLHRLVKLRLAPNDLLGNLTTEALAEACRCLDLKTGRKADMIAALLSHAPVLESEYSVAAVEILEPTRENVLNLLQNLHIPRRALQTEAHVEDFLYALLAPHFRAVATQFFVGGHLGTKIDIDIASQVGVEVKLAISLARATEIHRFMGQALHYRQRYTTNLIIVIAGLASDVGDPLLLEMRDLLATLGVTVVLIRAL
jgi:hypothetical protein